MLVTRARLPACAVFPQRLPLLFGVSMCFARPMWSDPLLGPSFEVEMRHPRRRSLDQELLSFFLMWHFCYEIYSARLERRSKEDLSKKKACEVATAQCVP